MRIQRSLITLRPFVSRLTTRRLIRHFTKITKTFDAKKTSNSPPLNKNATHHQNLPNDEEIVIHKGEVKDSNQIFEMVWNNLVRRHGDENMNFPKEILFLAGAPGAGKGAMTNFIKKVRGISTETIETSQLLKSPEAAEIKAKGGLVGSRQVVEMLLQKLLEPQFNSGVVVDGFPRTEVQAECIKHLYDKMAEYKNKFSNSIHSERFSRPFFSITVLFIEEELSVKRQMKRGGEILAHNRRVSETGYGDKLELRQTDISPELARKRYRQFKENIYESLRAVKNFFNFHFILADAEPEVVKSRILKELEYQSSNELQSATFECVRRLPLASEVVRNARIEMVKRLDDYTKNHSVLFSRVIEVLKCEFFPLIKLQAITGKVVVRSENEVFEEKFAMRMALDLFTERGYEAYLDVQRKDVVCRVEPGGRVSRRRKRVFAFTIEFKRPKIRHTARFMI